MLVSWQGLHPSCRHPSTPRLLFHSSPCLPSAAQVPGRATAVKTQHAASRAVPGQCIHGQLRRPNLPRGTRPASSPRRHSCPPLSFRFPLLQQRALSTKIPWVPGLLTRAFPAPLQGLESLEKLRQLCHIWPPHSDTAAYACFFLAVNRAPSRTNNRYLQASFLPCGRVVHTAPPDE